MLPISHVYELYLGTVLVSTRYHFILHWVCWPLTKCACLVVSPEVQTLASNIAVNHTTQTPSYQKYDILMAQCKAAVSVVLYNADTTVLQ